MIAAAPEVPAQAVPNRGVADRVGEPAAPGGSGMLQPRSRRRRPQLSPEEARTAECDRTTVRVPSLRPYQTPVEPRVAGGPIRNDE